MFQVQQSEYEIIRNMGELINQSRSDTIMIVGDDPSFCYLMRRYVTKSAYNTVFAYLGEEALAMAQQERPAAIVLEVGRPDTLGWRVLRALRENPATRDIPVVLCSWLDEEERGLEEGAGVYLRKPILYEDFVAALASLDIHPNDPSLSSK